MARGYLAGALWGAVVAGVGAGTISVATGPVLSPKPEVAEALTGAAGAPPAAEPDRLPRTSIGDGASPQTDSPGIPEPDSGAEAAAGLADTMSTGRPETGEASALADAPDAGSDTAMAAAPDAPVAPGGQGAQPSQPDADELSISSSPAQPPAPVPSVDEVAPQLGGQAPVADDTAEAPLAETPVETALADPERTVPASEESAAPAASGPGPAPDASAAAPETAATPEAVDEPFSPTAEAAAPDVPVTPAAPEAEAEAPSLALVPQTPASPVETPVQATEEAPERPQVTVLIDEAEAEEDSRPTVGTPAGTVGNLAPRVRIGRLPTLSNDTAATEAEQDPLTRYAEPVEVEEGKPMMSIVLIDDGTTPMGLEALEAFPYPITFAVDTAWQGATEAMRTYRDAGFEVVALANLPEGARPQDTEVTLGSALDTVTEAVAVLEGDRGGLQESRGVSEQVARILADSGHGLVLYPKGLNTGQALAAKEGVPSAVLFRDFDGNGQSATVIRRFLDQAAFKAGQEGAVIMLGRLRAETISALLIWGLQDRANRVSFVPVSQVLLFDEADS